jgi:hypothetical protein
MNRFLLALGALFILTGLLWRLITRMYLFHLPGEVVVDCPGFKFMVPITTMVIVSVVLSFLAWSFRR